MCRAGMRRKKEEQVHEIKTDMRPVRCPEFGRKILDAGTDTKMQFITPVTDRDLPDSCGNTTVPILAYLAAWIRKIPRKCRYFPISITVEKDYGKKQDLLSQG